MSSTNFSVCQLSQYYKAPEMHVPVLKLYILAGFALEFSYFGWYLLQSYLPFTFNKSMWISMNLSQTVKCEHLMNGSISLDQVLYLNQYGINVRLSSKSLV
jgi:hypothetical protein